MVPSAFVRMLSLSLALLAFLAPRCCADGLATRNLIVGGAEAPEGRYSYTVSIKDAVTGLHFCGGSLISKSIVLTAAHCVAFDDPIILSIGRHNLTHSDIGDDVEVDEKVPHPGYDMFKSEDYDIALIKLARPTTANVDIVTVNSDKALPIAGNSATYLGWGEIDSDDLTVNVSQVLREVDSNVITNERCEEVEGLIDGTTFRMSYDDLISEVMLCTYRLGKDSCQKDSGGPLILRGNDASADVQVGVASWGLGCASLVFPGVTCRISAVYGWVRGHVCAKSDPGTAPASFDCDNIYPGSEEQAIVDEHQSSTHNIFIFEGSGTPETLGFAKEDGTTTTEEEEEPSGFPAATPTTETTPAENTDEGSEQVERPLAPAEVAGIMIDGGDISEVETVLTEVETADLPANPVDTNPGANSVASEKVEIEIEIPAMELPPPPPTPLSGDEMWDRVNDFDGGVTISSAAMGRAAKVATGVIVFAVAIQSRQ